MEVRIYVGLYEVAVLANRGRDGNAEHDHQAVIAK
jgi:hypothetical protein